MDDCTGFRHCLDGAFISVKLSCGAGLLFDESIHSCNWSHAVTCGSKRYRHLREAVRNLNLLNAGDRFAQKIDVESIK